jgi:hypothetical protein
MERHRIVAAAAQRLAAYDAAKTEPTAANPAEPGDGDPRIVRAARMETAARAEQRAQPALVTSNEQNDRP